MTESQGPPEVVNRISKEAKHFYSAGTVFSAFACASVVELAWSALGNLGDGFKSRLVGLILSLLIVFAYALLIPEPRNYPNAGKLRITVAEGIFGLFNALIVFAIALGINNL